MLKTTPGHLLTGYIQAYDEFLFQRLGSKESVIKQILDDIQKNEHRLGFYPLSMSNSLLTLTQEMAESSVLPFPPLPFFPFLSFPSYFSFNPHRGLGLFLSLLDLVS